MEIETKIIIINIENIDVPVKLTSHRENNLWRAHAKYVDPFTKKEEFDSLTAASKIAAERQLINNLTTFLKTRTQA